MALKIDHNITIAYTLNKYDDMTFYRNILTGEQLKELEQKIEKTFLIKGTYCKITNVTGNRDYLEITLTIYKDENKQVIIGSKVYSFVPSIEEGAANFIKQGYLYLKTLPEYKDAIDVLED